MIRTLSFDPGETNFAVAIQEHRVDSVRDLYQSRALYSSLIKSPVQSLRDGTLLREQARGLRLEIIGLYREFGPFDDVSLERFMGRGVKVGTTSETTNIMIGMISSVLYEIAEIPFPSLVNASTWKVEANKNFDLKLAYKQCATSNHQLDAALIGHYRASKLIGMRPFEAMRDELTLHRLMWWLEKVTDEPLTKRRAKRLFHQTPEDWYLK